MEESDRRQCGVVKFHEVYGSDTPAPPAGTLDFYDVMIEQLFGEIWTRPELSLRDRRLVIMGVIAALGEGEIFAMQVRSAIKNGELTPTQCREILIHLSQYAGYPRAVSLLSHVEKAIAEVEELSASA